MGVPSISDAIAAIGAARQIASLLAKSTTAVEIAELKLKLAELMTSLAEAQVALSIAQDIERDTQQELLRLEEMLQLKGEPIKGGDGYFLKGADGVVDVDPCCLYCWEFSHRLIHLTRAREDLLARVCPHCKHQVSVRSLRTPSPSPPHRQDN